MKLSYVVRAFVLDTKNKVLLVKHKKNEPRVLPGGHVEDGESLTRALKREIKEELSVDIQILGIKNHTNDSAVMMKPLPICVHEVQYEWDNQLVSKLEFRYFARAESTKIKTNTEVVEKKWFTIPEVLNLTTDQDIFASTKDVLKQNEDLLELL